MNIACTSTQPVRCSSPRSTETAQRLALAAIRDPAHALAGTLSLPGAATLRAVCSARFVARMVSKVLAPRRAYS
jgi:hypothetical protein